MLREITAVCLLCIAMNAQAGSLDGNKLVKGMRDYESFERDGSQVATSKATHFLGYVSGVADAVNGVLYCPPQNANLGQAASIVVQFMSANPARWSESAAVLVVDALKKAFPC